MMRPSGDGVALGRRVRGSGERIFKLRAREGDRLAYTVNVRNPTSEVVSVTGVAADENRDGAFVPEWIGNGPVAVKPGATVLVVQGCP